MYICLLICIISPYVYMHHYNGKKYHTGMILFYIIRVYSQKFNIRYPISEFFCVSYFLNGTNIVKEQEIDEPYVLMLCMVVNKIGCLVLVYSRKHNFQTKPYEVCNGEPLGGL